MASFTCAHCGVTSEYENRGGRARRFCSPRCKTDFHNLQHRAKEEAARPPRSLVCARCGGALEHERRPGALRKYCSDNCREARNREYYRDEYAPRSAVGYADCEFCGKLFVTRIAKPGARACRDTGCQRLLRNAQMRDYRRSYAEKHGHALERQFADSRTDGRHRRRAMLKGVYVETVRITDIIARDGWACGICGDPIDSDLQWPHLMSKTVDHIRALANGGAHSLENCQLAHLTCNSSKRDTVGTAPTD